MQVTSSPNGRIGVHEPTDPQAGIALVTLHGPRCGLKGSALLTLEQARELRADLDALIGAETVRRLGACADALLGA